MSSLRFKIKQAYWNKRDKIQKLIRGYSDTDINELYQWFIDTLRPMIKQFRKSTNSFPSSYLVDGLDEKEWDKTLKEMEKCLYMMDEHHVMDYYKYKFDNLTLEQSAKVYKTMMKNKDRFFDLFKEYFYDMWN